MDLQAELAEGFAQLSQGHRGIVHAEHFPATSALEDRIGQPLGGDVGVIGDDLGEHLLHVDHFHQLIVDLGDRSQVVLPAGGSRRRHHRFPVQVDDAVHATDQKGLHGAVVLSDDDGAALVRHQWPQADGSRQIDHRQGLPAQVDHAAHRTVSVRHQRHLRQLDNFLHLEDVDGELLPPAEPEHENFQAILPHEAGALID